MWNYCETDSNTEIKFYIDGEFLCVNSVISDDFKIPEPKLYACFFNNINFLIGKYICSDGVNRLDKKYSLSYLNAQGIDCNKLSHFMIDYGNENKIRAYPKTNDNIDSDPAIIGAKKALSLVKSKIKINNIHNLINNVRLKAQRYKLQHMPYMQDYTWYAVNNLTEDFGLSAIRHIISSEEFSCINNEWYFGFSPDNRVYAISVKSKTKNKNPLYNADDCTIMYFNENSDDVFYVAGLLLLDDGQYFCRLN